MRSGCKHRLLNRAYSLTWPASMLINTNKRVCTKQKSSIPTGLSWYTNMAAVSLLWNTNMADVTSCAHTCYLTYIIDFGYLVGSAELRKCEHAKKQKNKTKQKKKNGRKLAKVKATEGRRNRNDYYRLSLPLLFSPCQLFVCISLSRLLYYLRAWNRLR